MKNKFKYMEIKIVRPIILHEDEVVNLKKLEKELEILSSINGIKNTGIYVYKKGFDYPQSSFVPGQTIHTWHKMENVLRYIKEFKSISNCDCAIVKWTEHSYYFEPVKNEEISN